MSAISNGTETQKIDWYHEPLSGEDLFAGLSLLLFGVTGIAIYFIIAAILFKNSKETTGFRYLLSRAAIDIVLVFCYGVWPGLTILFKSEITPASFRFPIHFFIDWVWIAMCYHYPIVAWSRLSAIRFPMFFRAETPRRSYLICSICYIAAFIQILIAHTLPWYALFYYEPSIYGTFCIDFPKYYNDGFAQYMNVFHFIIMTVPFLIYVLCIFYLLKHKHQKSKVGSEAAARNRAASNLSKVEINLMVPCILNTVVFMIGQILLLKAWDLGKWFSWAILMLFDINSLVNPLFLIIFSSAIREKLVKLVRNSIPFLPGHNKVSNTNSIAGSQTFTRHHQSGSTISKSKINVVHQ